MAKQKCIFYERSAEKDRYVKRCKRLAQVNGIFCLGHADQGNPMVKLLGRAVAERIARG